jgi:hypothetical protein
LQLDRDTITSTEVLCGVQQCFDPEKESWRYVGKRYLFNFSFIKNYICYLIKRLQKVVCVTTFVCILTSITVHQRNVFELHDSLPAKMLTSVPNKRSQRQKSEREESRRDDLQHLPLVCGLHPLAQSIPFTMEDIH